MKIPKSFMLKGKEWRVSYSRSLIDDSGNECDGLCYKEDRKIVIRKGLEKEYQFLVFLHEYFHACLKELHVDLDPGLEEVIVDGLSTITLETFSLSKRRKVSN